MTGRAARRAPHINRPAFADGHRPGSTTRPTDLRELALRLAAPIGAVLAVLAILWSIGFLADIDGPQNALIGLYNTFGLTDQAEALAQDGLDPVLSKAILGIVGLAVGIGGIWFIYIGVHSILEMLGRSGTAASCRGCSWPRAPHRQRLPRIPGRHHDHHQLHRG